MVNPGMGGGRGERGHIETLDCGKWKAHRIPAIGERGQWRTCTYSGVGEKQKGTHRALGLETGVREVTMSPSNKGL